MIECVVYNPVGAGRCKAARVGILDNGQAVAAKLPQPIYESFRAKSQFKVELKGTKEADALLKLAGQETKRRERNAKAKATPAKKPSKGDKE